MQTPEVIDPRKQYLHYPSKHALGIGISLLVFGLLSIIFHVVTIVFETGIYVVGYGIWGGLLYIIAGALTVGAAKASNKGLIAGSLVMCIFGALAGAVQVSMGVFGGVWSIYENEWYDSKVLSTESRMVIHTFMAAFGMAAMVLSIIASGFGCRSMYKLSQQTSIPIRMVTLQDGTTIQAVFLPNSGGSNATSIIRPEDYDHGAKKTPLEY